VSAILKAKILDRYSWETNPLKRVLKFLLGVYISIGEKGDKNTERDQSRVSLSFSANTYNCT
jgi:hypothetical protein